MADTQETIADIIAEMRAREDLDGGDMVDNFDIYIGEYGGWDALMLIKAYADRLEAALKREKHKETITTELPWLVADIQLQDGSVVHFVKKESEAQA